MATARLIVVTPTRCTMSAVTRTVRTCLYQTQRESTATSKWSGRPSGDMTARNVRTSSPLAQRSFQKKNSSTMRGRSVRPTLRYQFHSRSGDQPRMP